MRVLLATDSSDLGHALTLFLGERHIHVLDVLDDTDTLLEQTSSRRPDVVIVDWGFGETATARVVAELTDGDGATPVVVLSTPQERGRARACGAAACATLGDHPETLLAVLRQVGPDPRAEARG